MTVAQRSRAHDMIAAKGQTVTLTRIVSGAYNPATGTSTQTTSTQTGKGVILPLSAGLRHASGTTIPHGAKQCLLSGLNSAGTVLTAPVLDDKLTADGIDYTIAEISPLEPAGLAIIYDLTVVAAA